MSDTTALSGSHLVMLWWPQSFRIPARVLLHRVIGQCEHAPRSTTGVLCDANSSSNSRSDKFSLRRVLE